MTRLTNDFRAAIVKNALGKAGLNKKQNDIAQRRAEWAEAFRVDALGGPDRVACLESLEAQFQALREKVPEDVRSHIGELTTFRSIIKANIAGARVMVSGWPGGKMAPYEHTITADNPLCQKFYDLEAESAALSKERDEIQANVRGVLESVNTVKQLLAIWPEAVELLPALPEANPRNLPAVRVAELNKLVGLPTYEL